MALEREHFISAVTGHDRSHEAAHATAEERQASRRARRLSPARRFSDPARVADKQSHGVTIVAMPDRA